VVRQVALFGTTGTVIYSNLATESVEAAIDNEIEYFRSIGQDFEWKVFGHDQPPDLVQRLAARGFEVDETEAVMVLDLATAPAFSPALVVTRIQDPDQVRDVAYVKQRVYPDYPDEKLASLAAELADAPEALSIYVAYVDASPAACGWIRLPPKSQFASLWGGSTLPEHRNQGLYTALLGVRVEEARQRGFPYVTIDAGRMSRPIVEKHGFRLLTTATACNWTRSLEASS
jgi:GNAT superfamily N-acetyltransferase